MVLFAVFGIACVSENGAKGLFLRLARIATGIFQTQILYPSCATEQEIRDKRTRILFHSDMFLGSNFLGLMWVVRKTDTAINMPMYLYMRVLGYYLRKTKRFSIPVNAYNYTFRVGAVFVVQPLV